MKRILHISDLHLPARREGQVAALADAVARLRADLLVVSGDLTRRGSRKEFAAAAEFLSALPKPQLVIPGNHDVPLFPLTRMTRPFRRYRKALTEDLAPLHVDDEIAVAGLNTSRGVQARLDWSLGRISGRAVRRATERLSAVPTDRTRIAVTHHPLAPDIADLRRSQVRGAASAVTSLALAGVGIMLHGHLHRPRVDVVDVASRKVVMVGATTALSDRERGGGSGFNVLDIVDGVLTVAESRWNGTSYELEPPRPVPVGASPVVAQPV
ncbi:metallophosphoesterase family protein [Lutibaculum baratangense]|uniref:Metallophosphoesterase n=1 Tax=Lutibaculum baratangense AMV1 TaxID=631454 RepID=V4QTS0_9HYPH|nr:metallophosphoesterase [Lutibaculum baratangense]ESR23167.1 metallophosphoesterase [Lutibaculum baratangense AMV1]